MVFDEQCISHDLLISDLPVKERKTLERQRKEREEQLLPIYQQVLKLGEKICTTSILPVVEIVSFSERLVFVRGNHVTYSCQSDMSNTLAKTCRDLARGNSCNSSVLGMNYMLACCRIQPQQRI